MIPVAGRRKGLSQAPNLGSAGNNETNSSLGGGFTTSTGAAPSPATAGDALSFLDFDNDTGPTQASAPVASRRGAPTAAPPQRDTLSFLDFDDDEGPSKPSAPAASRRTAPPVAPAPAQSAPSFLDFDDDDGPTKPPPRSQPPASAASRGAPAQAVPSFLDFDDDAPANVPSTPQPSAAVSLEITNRWHELQKELQRVQVETLSCEEVIRKFESGEHELCLEVGTLDEQVQQKQAAGEKAAAAREELERALELRRQQLTEENEAKHKQLLVEGVNTMRERYEDELSTLTASVEDQKVNLLAVEEKHSTMDGSISSVELYERAVCQLQERLKVTLRDISAAVCLRIKPSLTNCIRDTVAQFAQERSDMQCNDRRRRREQLDTFQKNVDKGFSSFCEERRTKHQSRVDSIFGGERFRFQAEVERRFTTSRMEFMERQKELTAEAKKGALITFEEMTRRAAADMEVFQRKMKEELRLMEERYAAELAHLARLQASEKAAALRPRCENDELGSSVTAATPSVCKAVEKDVRYLRERVEQIKQSVSLDIQDLSIASQHPRCESLSALGKERMLAELEEKVRLLSRQFGAQWQRFKSAVGPLHQSVQLMVRGLQDGRVRAAGQQQETECIYREWTQSVRKELSMCLTSGGASSESAELQSGLVSMTRVVEMARAQVQAVLEAQRHRSEVLRGFNSEVQESLSALVKQRVASNGTLHSVFDEYERLSHAAAEVEAKRRALEVAAENYDHAKQVLEKERETFDGRLKVAQELGVKLRIDSEKLERKAARYARARLSGGSQFVRAVTVEKPLRDRLQCGKRMEWRSQSHGHLPRKRAADCVSCHLSPSSAEYRRSATASNGGDVLDFVTLLSFDDAVGQGDSGDLQHKRQPCQYRGTTSFDPSSCGSDGTYFTTPSTLN
ncbi:uncharacterized protein TEOVI_000289300 [Trypanosoma equiperdum]|uniref:Uncharacterized protein n=1 Tax=Trypanosoma equiperdum TaxID=5694 RepID=A0A1G4IG26_TRYEQ|nr:hypothetical protein, conserved [Trypanosoma equiperdum]